MGKARRGEFTIEQMVILLLFAAAALILIVWWMKTQYSVLGMKDVEACRLSVEGYAKLWVNPTGTGATDIHLVQPDCTRQVITFTEDHVETNGKKSGYYDPDRQKSESSYSTLTPGIVNSVAASEMATCWYEFLEGKSYWTNQVDIGNDNTACFVCGELHFDKGATFDASKQTPFFDFLATNTSRPYPKVIGSQPPTYLEYLYLQPHICDHSTKSIAPDTISLLKPFGIPWYNGSEGGSCEQQFAAKIVFGQVEGSALTVLGIPHFLPTEYKFVPFMKDLKLTPDQSYVIIFYQLGQDEDLVKKRQNGEVVDTQPAGTTYAPLIIPASEYTTDLCGTFLG